MKTGVLKGKIAIVTGGGRGIGRQTALDLASLGAKVAICSRTERELKQVKAEIEALGGECVFFNADVSKESDAKMVVEKTIGKYGRIDVLVNNAGIVLRKPVHETTAEEFEKILAVNVLGPFYFTKHVLNAAMLKRKSGVIVNVSSMAGKRGIPLMSAYCATKFALVGMTESVAKELDGSGIRVYAVCSRGVDTRLYREAFPGRKLPVFKPKDIAEKIIAFCKPGCKFATGTCLDVDFEKR
jgi:3-oxoacyl-[acyl-carrier protein] reductase